ncbi:MAG: hypothetical protein EBR86_00065 [Planctomycetia bacterium]|nr:hypothetical protein [Planctomycetia bacterium]
MTASLAPDRDAGAASAEPRGAAATTPLRYWIDDPAIGSVNMAADEWLAGVAVSAGVPVARFSTWSRATLSLGAFQAAAAVPADGLAALPLVRRASGGGAILHGTDLTCTVAVPRSHPWGGEAQRLYDEVHRALVGVLAAAGLRAALHPAVGDPGAAAAATEAFLCFDRRATGDVVLPAPTGRWPKILGSAQRRHHAAVVQHGSLLWSRNDAAGGPHARLGLADVAATAGVRLDPIGVRDAWLAEIAAAAGLLPALQPGCTWDADRAAIADLAARYGDAAWTHRR